jgi:para-nitrobenzyl esterase
MKKLLIGVFVVLGFSLVAESQVQSGETIAVTNTESGKARGYVSNNIFVYKGIPYAEADRFEAPRKTEPWTGIRDFLVWGPVAYLETPTTIANQEAEFLYNHDFGYPGEDCLRLNIWTPGINDGKKRPVMFWLHGGGYSVGSSQETPCYDGENLAKKGDVIVVTINHRLNVLGFLDLSAYGEKYKYSANNSMLDIRVALEWVKDNIANFGGDPDNVTIFGQSGGDGKVNILMAMPTAKGLFHKAINESGAFQSSLKEKTQTQAVADQLLQILDINPSNVDTLLKIPFQVLADAYLAAVKKAYPNGTKPSDLIDVDIIFRPGAIAQANQKSRLTNAAPVYMYLFGWRSPALDGKYEAWHCMELPFVFNNIEKNWEMTGGGKEAYTLAEKIS